MTPPSPEQRWSLASVREVLAQYGLAPARRASLEVHPLAGGTANLNLRVVVGGQALVLRRYATAAEPAAVRWELDLVRFLTARGYPTAPLLATPAGALAVPFTGRVAALFRFLPGGHPDEASLPAAEAVTTAVAELHRLTAGVTLPSPRATPPMESGRRLAWFATLDLPPGGDPALGALQQDVRAFRRALEARLEPVRLGLPTGVVHHDAHNENVLVDATGELVALLDFDDAHPNLLLADLAVLLWYWAASWADPHLDRARAAHLVACYQRVRPLLPVEEEVLPDLVAQRLLARALKDVRRALRQSPPTPAVAGLPALDHFRALTIHPDWRDTLRTQLLAPATAVWPG